MEDNWPEFLYGKKTVEEYLQIVLNEKRDIKHEISALVHLIRDVAKYPFETQEETFVRISLLCGVVQHLIGLT
jgi:hypothetical protein